MFCLLMFQVFLFHHFLFRKTPFSHSYKVVWISLVAQMVTEKAMAPHSSILAWKIPWMEEPGGLQSMVSRSRTRLSNFTFTFHSHALEKEMATHFGVLAWRIPGTEEPGRLPSLGSHRVGHNWSDLAAAAAAECKKNTEESYIKSNSVVAFQRWNYNCYLLPVLLLYIFSKFWNMSIYLKLLPSSI